MNLTPVGEKETATSYCQVNFNKQRKVSQPRANSLSPKYNDVFLFDIEDLSYPLKISLFEHEGSEAVSATLEPPKEDLLGSITVSLQEVSVDMSGDGNPNKAWYNLKRKPRRAGYKLTPKLRVELSYILKSKLEDTGESARLAQDSDEEGADLTLSSTTTPLEAESGIFGIRRGRCKEAECDCELYQAETPKGGTCQNCGHWPAQHDNLGPMAEGEEYRNSGFAPAPSGPTGTSLKSARSWEIDATELQLGKCLGEGTSAMVYQGTYRAQEVAIKVLKEKAEAKVIEEFQKEFDIMR